MASQPLLGKVSSATANVTAREMILQWFNGSIHPTWLKSAFSRRKYFSPMLLTTNLFITLADLLPSNNNFTLEQHVQTLAFDLSISLSMWITCQAFDYSSLRRDALFTLALPLLTFGNLLWFSDETGDCGETSMWQFPVIVAFLACGVHSICLAALTSLFILVDLFAGFPGTFVSNMFCVGITASLLAVVMEYHGAAGVIQIHWAEEVLSKAQTHIDYPRVKSDNSVAGHRPLRHSTATSVSSLQSLVCLVHAGASSIDEDCVACQRLEKVKAARISSSLLRLRKNTWRCQRCDALGTDFGQVVPTPDNAESEVSVARIPLVDLFKTIPRLQDLLAMRERAAMATLSEWQPNLYLEVRQRYDVPFGADVDRSMQEDLVELALQRWKEEQEDLAVSLQLVAKNFVRQHAEKQALVGRPWDKVIKFLVDVDALKDESDDVLWGKSQLTWLESHTSNVFRIFAEMEARVLGQREAVLAREIHVEL